MTHSTRNRRTTDAWRVVRWLALPLLVAALPAQAQQVTYADIAPLLNKRCALCHAGTAAPRGLLLDSLDGVLAGSSRGPVVRAGDPDGSELVRRLTGASQPRMPMTGPPYLDDADVERIRRWITAGLPAGTGATTSTSASPTPRVPGTPVTWNDVAPLFATRCAKCHADNGLMGEPPEGYRLTSHAAALASGERARIVPGRPDASELVRRIRGQSRPRMPFDAPPYLTAAQITLVEQWVQQGARDGNGTPAALPVGARVRIEGTLGRGWHLDDLPLQVTPDTRIDDRLGPGQRAEVRGHVASDGTIVVERLRR